MDGFSQFCCRGGPYPAYSYVKRSLIKPYWDMAQQYVLADEMFPTEWGGSFTGHLTLVAGTDDIAQAPSEAEIDSPTAGPYDCDSPPGTKSSYVTSKQKVEMNKGPFPCFDQWNSIAEVLDNAGVSWKYYATRKLDAGIWEPFEAMRYVRYGPDWADEHHRAADEDINRSRQSGLGIGKLCHSELADSDHHPLIGRRAATSALHGWHRVVNAIGESSYWNSSAIIVVWDDWGGWYDQFEAAAT